VIDTSAASRYPPPRDQLTVTGEHNRLRRIRRDIHRDLPPAVVLERLRDELTRKSPASTPDITLPIDRSRVRLSALAPLLLTDCELGVRPGDGSSSYSPDNQGKAP
jgi:hypothetical protein